MQAILTKVLPATNTKPTRIKASCARGSVIISTTHQTDHLGSDEAHREAVSALVAKFADEDRKQYGEHPDNPWLTPFVTGTLPSGEKVHVFSDHEQKSDNGRDSVR